MKRFKWFFTIAVIMALFVAAPAHAVLQDMHATVYSWNGNYNADGSPGLTKLTTGVSFHVLAKGTDTLETLYVYGSMTSLTNPVSAANFASSTYCGGQVKFRVDPTDSTDDRYVDLVVRDNNGGYTEFIKNFDKYTHTIIIDERIGVPHVGMYRMGVLGTANSEHYTGVRFLADTIITDVKVKVITVSAATLKVGIETTTSGTYPTGFINGLSIATAGFAPDPAFSTTAVSSKYGALLALYPAASGPGGPIRSGFTVTGTSPSYLTLSYDSATGGNSNIYYWFTRIN